MKRIATLLPLVIALLALFTFTAGAFADGDPSDPALYSNDWRTTGPQGGDVRALVVDPQNPDRFYFGTLDGQIYTSDDGGKQWRLLYNFGKPRLFVDEIIVDPRNSKVLYVGAHRHNLPGGFFKSTDGGATWKESGDLKSEAIHSLAQSESDPDTLIAGTFTGVFRSDDAGQSWKKLPTQSEPGLLHVESLAIDPRTSDTIYAGTFYLPYKTVDGGKSWKSIKNGIIDDSDIFAIDIDPRDPNHIIASACSGIYESKNAGEEWRKVQGIPSQSRRTRAILQHPSVPGMVFAGTTEGFWLSDKSGAADSWMVTTSRQLEINSIAVHPSRPDMIFIGTNNYGVMVSNDGGKSFVPTNGGFSGRFANAILADRETPNRVYASTINTATGGGFFFVSDDNGESWRKVQGIPSQSRRTRAILQHPTMAGIVFAGTTEGFWRSDKGGDPDSWMVTTSRQLEINSIAVHPSRPDMIFIATNNYGVMVSNDGGKSFTPTNGGFSGRFANAILADREAPNRVYASTINTATGGGFFFVSDDNGESWKPSMRSMPSRLITYAILQDARDANIIYLGTNLGVYRSTDRGTTWAPVWAVEKKKAPAKKTSRTTKATAAVATKRRPVSVSTETVAAAQQALNAAGYHLAEPD
ncbi:MAG TPA: YCF48-related protein, partial [Pyrinomonadaceae bacterium]|nr:YCF48-related protein [Pyrinomonadaceae bacterium]